MYNNLRLQFLLRYLGAPMKRLLLSISILVSGLQPSIAQSPWFAVALNCNVSPTKAVCSIANTGTLPMFCQVRADGQVANMTVIYAYFNGVVPPGQYRYATVYSNPPNPPIVGAVGGGQCRY